MDTKAQQSNKNALPIRKPNRLKDYDYSQDGAYFITICVKDSREILGKIVEDAALGVPTVKLTEIGEIVRQHVEHIGVLSEYVRLDNYVIMPNHIHLIIFIVFHAFCTLQLIYRCSGTPKGASPTAQIKA